MKAKELAISLRRSPVCSGSRRRQTGRCMESTRARFQCSSHRERRGHLQGTCLSPTTGWPFWTDSEGVYGGSFRRWRHVSGLRRKRRCLMI